jgi:molybdate transport system permease protein
VRRFTANPLLPAGAAASVLYLVFIGLPLAALVVRAASGEGLGRGISHPVVFQALRLSALTTSASMLLVAAVGTPLAWLLARRRSPILRLVGALVELPIVLPPVVAGVALLMAFGRRGLAGPPLEALGVTIPFTTAAVVLAEVFVAAPFYIRAARIGFSSVREGLEEVSLTLGMSPWQTFLRLTLPIARPALLGGLVLAWARAFSEFGATLMFAGNLPGRTQTLPLAIMDAMETDLPAALAMSLVAVAVAAAVLGLLAVTGQRDNRAAT